MTAALLPARMAQWERDIIIRENHPAYPYAGIPTPDDEEFRELQRQWYELAGYAVERDEYRVIPQMFGGQHTRTFFEDTDQGIESTDDEDLTDIVDYEPSYDEDVGYDLAAEVEQFARDVAAIAGLTEREREVVEWIASGNSMIGDYAPRLADALGITVKAAQRAKAKAVDKLREHWAGDMDAQGLVDPRYLEPIRADEVVCPECHLIRHRGQINGGGRCIECEENE